MIGDRLYRKNEVSNMWLVFAFASALFAGLTAILAKIGIKNTDSGVATAIRTIVILIFSWIMVFVTKSTQPICDIEMKPIIFLILSGMATGASWLCYFKALQLGDVNKVTPIDKSSTVLTMLLAFVILGEELSMTRIISMVAIGAGTLLMITKKETADTRANGKGWLFYAVLSALFASLTAILGKIGITDIPSNLGTAIRTIVVLVMAWLVVFVTGKQKEVKKIDQKSLFYICLSGMTTGLSWLCYYRALQDGDAGIVVPIDKLSIVVTIAFSYFVLKEKLTKKAFIGFLIMVAGTFLLLV